MTESLTKFPRRTMASTAGGVSGELSQIVGSEQSIGQSGYTISATNNAGLTRSVSLTQNATNSAGGLAGLPHRNLHSTVPLQNNSSPRPLVLPDVNNNNNNNNNNALSGIASNSITSSNLTQLSSLHQSVTSGSGGGESSSANTFPHSARQNSSNPTVSGLQNTNPRDSTPMPTHQLQEVMMPRSGGGGVSHMSGQLIPNANTFGSSLSNGSGHLMPNANGFRSSSNGNEVIQGSNNDGVGIGSSVSDSDSGNIGGVATSSFSDGLMNQSYFSGNENHHSMMGLESSLSVSNNNNTDSLMGGALHNNSSTSMLIGDEHGLLHDPSPNFAYDFGSNDLFSWNS